MQTHNQDYLAGLSKEDLDYLHPDNTADLNAEAVTTTTRELQADQRDAVSTSFGENVSSLVQHLVEGAEGAELDDEDDDDEDDFDLGDDE